MGLIKKIFTIIIMLGLLLSASAYVIIYTEDDSNNGGKDTTPPQITDITGNFTAIAGHTVTIIVLFTDNINLTESTLYYKIAGSTTWTTDTILSGSVSIYIPPETISNYYTMSPSMMQQATDLSVIHRRMDLCFIQLP